MRSVFAEFAFLWPEKSRKALQPLLEKIQFLYFPDDHLKILAAENHNNTIIIMNSGEMKDLVQMTLLGFSHVVQRSRADFPQELLASALMVARPSAFKKDPIPFFFTGFANSKGSTEPLENLKRVFHRSEDKSDILHSLVGFLKHKPQLEILTDLCVQIADELIANALFNAPVDFRGDPIFQQAPRTRKIEMPSNKPITLFVCYSDYRLVIGCEDLYGSLKRHVFVTHLELALGGDMARPRPPHSAGAGLGLRYIIENSAGFYAYCERGARSLIACGLVLQGLKANVGPQKHIHLSIL